LPLLTLVAERACGIGRKFAFTLCAVRQDCCQSLKEPSMLAHEAMAPMIGRSGPGTGRY
jgi:hypothetical protein